MYASIIHCHSDAAAVIYVSTGQLCSIQIVTMMLQVFDDDVVIVVEILTCDSATALSYLRFIDVALSIIRIQYQ
jgi:tRNA threonylcarbamoyladenosine modification (KEOPS) complex  Pcc1 subunit